jgi:hypothetical protein
MVGNFYKFVKIRPKVSVFYKIFNKKYAFEKNPVCFQGAYTSC